MNWMIKTDKWKMKKTFQTTYPSLCFLHIVFYKLMELNSTKTANPSIQHRFVRISRVKLLIKSWQVNKLLELNWFWKKMWVWISWGSVFVLPVQTSNSFKIKCKSSFASDIVYSFKIIYRWFKIIYRWFTLNVSD
jgi:hypothetical protein